MRTAAFLCATAACALVAPAVAQQVIYRATPSIVTTTSPGTSTPTSAPVVAAPASGDLLVAHGTTWNVRLAVSGGKAPYAVAATGLPAGASASVSGSTATISGTTVPGSYDVVATVTDADGKSASSPSFRVVVEAPLSVAQPAASSLTVASGADWNVALKASGGRAPYVFTVSPAVTGGTLAAASVGDTWSITGRTSTVQTYGPWMVSVQDALGNSSASSPFSVKVEAGPSAMYGWGSYSERLLPGASSNKTSPYAVTSYPAGVDGYSDVAMKYTSMCGIASGEIYCGGSETQTGTTTPVKLDRPTGVVAWTKLSVGQSGSTQCAEDQDGSAWCWGSNTYGQLGNGTTTTSYVPVKPSIPAGSGLTKFSSISTGAAFTCGMGSDGSIWCWGDPGQGGAYTLANGVNASTIPVKVTLPAGSGTPVRVATQHQGACAEDSLGGVWCWGRNDLGNGGMGSATSNLATPTKTRFPAGVTSYSNLVSGSQHSCATGNDGNTWCWGRNHAGQLGNGTTTSPGTTPTKVSQVVAGITYSRLSGGWGSTCGLGSNGVWYCWGANSFGQLGIGSFSDASVPTPVVTTAMGSVSKVQAGFYTGYALK